MTCCHYDEGYEDGLAKGKDERGYERSDVVDTLRLLSREHLLAGNYKSSDFVAALADEVARDTFIANRVANERDRLAELLKLYAAAKVAA